MTSKEQIQLFQQMLDSQAVWIAKRIRNETNRFVFDSVINELYRKSGNMENFDKLHRAIFGEYRNANLEKYGFHFFSNPKKYTVMANTVALGIVQSIDARFNGWYYYES